MKNKSQKKVLIAIGVVLLLTSLLAIYLSFKLNNNDDNPIDNPSNPSTGNSEVIKEAKQLDNERIFFNIQNTIGKYYVALADKDNKYVYNSLDKDYINENNITIDNVLDKVKSNYESVYYTATDIYYKKGINITYYFVTGYIINTTILDGEISYEDTINYIVMVKGDKFVLKMIDSNISNLYEYALNYEIKDIDGINSIVSQSISEKSKLVSYISRYKDLLFIDTKRAYNMLDDETKEKYSNYDNFKNNISNVYDSLSIDIFSFNYVENEKTYYVKDENQNTIKIIENSIMNYKINF